MIPGGGTAAGRVQPGGIEQIFFHCAKALLRSSLWKPENWEPDTLPSHARIVKDVQHAEESLEELEHRYGPGYANGLYQD